MNPRSATLKCFVLKSVVASVCVLNVSAVLPVPIAALAFISAFTIESSAILALVIQLPSAILPMFTLLNAISIFISQ